MGRFIVLILHKWSR